MFDIKEKHVSTFTKIRDNKRMYKTIVVPKLFDHLIISYIDLEAETLL